MTTINTETGTVTSPEEVASHEQKMAETFDKSQQPPVTEPPVTPPATETTEKPDWLPEKFWDAEKGAARTEELAKAGTESENEALDIDAAEKAVNDAGLDFSALQTEFMESEGFSEATYATLAEKGISKDIVDSYIAGQQAVATQFQQEAMAVVGGEETFTRMSEWAAKNLSKEELGAYNSVADKGDLDAVKLALSGLHAKYVAAGEDAPNLLNGDQTSGDVPTFRNWAQVTAAMSDPRYTTDPAYREEVSKKLNSFNG